MKRSILLFAFAALFALAACTPAIPSDKNDGTEEEGIVNISLWTYPVGGWGNSGTVSSQVAAFNKAYPKIHLTIKLIDYDTGDAEVDQAVAENRAPDLILEGPERLVAKWGARGLMADIGDLWESDVAEEIYENVRVACHNADGKYYIYPMCMTTHCMAINKDLFKKADAWQYVDEETHTWSSENFFRAVAALKSYGMEEVAAVYCGGQGGDQGTRALVNNLYGGTFTDAGHTRYTLDSAENIRALNALKNADGIVFDSAIVGGDEIEKFCKQELAMAFCWNVSMEIKQTIEKTFDFDIFPMAFPTDDGEPDLQGGIWGFGIFDNKDEARLNAAKTFIKFIMENDARYSAAVNASAYWPVREVGDLYLNDKLMSEYSIFGRYLGDYYQITPGWTEARTAWWQMLQSVSNGDDVTAAVKRFNETANAAV